MTIRHTDVLIVGGELAGAVAAAVCARAGRRVVVLEEGEGDDSITLSGVVAPPLDDLWPALDGLSRGMAPLEALGQKQDLRRTLPFSLRGLQLLHPEHRMDVPPDADHRTRECAREFPADVAPAVVTAMGALDSAAQSAWARMDGQDVLAVDGFFASRKARSVTRAAFAQPVEPTVFPEPAAWFQQSLEHAMSYLTDGGAVPPVARRRLFQALMVGLHVAPTGARNALRAQLLEAARQRGAEVNRTDRVSAFVVDGGRVGEVRLEGRSDGLGSKALIDATRSRDLKDRLSPEKHARKLDAQQQVTPVVAHRVGLVWALKREGVPPGLSERALLVGTGTGAGEGPALLCTQRAPVAADAKKPAAGLATLSICVTAVPADVDAALVAARARLEALFPFTRRHLVEERVVAADGRRAVYGGPTEPSDLFGRTCATPFKGVYRAGRDVVPVLGVEGELWSGHAAAQHADRWASRKPLFGGSAEASA